MNTESADRGIATGDAQLLKKLLRDKSPEGSAALGEVLARSTDHPTRFAAIEALGKRKDDPAALDALVAAARSMANAGDGDNIPSWTIGAIAKHKGVRAVDALVDLAQKSPSLERCVVDALSRRLERDKAARNNGRVPAMFTACLNGPNGREQGARYAAVAGLAYCADEAALDTLIPLLDDDNVDVRTAVVRAVIHVGGARALAALKDRATRADKSELDWHLAKAIEKLAQA